MDSPMAITSLAPGFRFHPTDVELVKYYLKRKVLKKKLKVDAIAEVDLYKFEPQDLPEMSKIKGGDLKWYFFSPREKKFTRGVRANRVTPRGYWQNTGKDRPVRWNNEVVGMIKSLVYHQGKHKKSVLTNWVLHEYRLEDKKLAEMNVPQDTYVVCVLFEKGGRGPQNGSQYGAPFKEEDWSDEEEEEADTEVPDINNNTNLSEPNQETSMAATSEDDPNNITISPDNSTMSAAPLSGILPTPNDNLEDLKLNTFGSDDYENVFWGVSKNEASHDPGSPCGAPFKEKNWSVEEEDTDVPDINNTPNLSDPNQESSMAATSADDPNNITVSSANSTMSAAPLSENLQTPNDNKEDSMLDVFNFDGHPNDFVDFTDNEAKHDPGVSAPVNSDEGIVDGLPDLNNVHNNMPTTSLFDQVDYSPSYFQDLIGPDM